jgi:purine-binding chemotaxis protein CheW
VVQSSLLRPESPSSPAVRTAALVVTAGSLVCAIPVEHVVEAMRPLPVELLAGAPPFVRGVSIIRGVPVPVVDLNALLTNADAGGASERLVLLRVADRVVALAVGRVVGLRHLDHSQQHELPPLLTAVGADIIESIGASDAQLLLVLRMTRILPEVLSTTLALGKAEA